MKYTIEHIKNLTVYGIEHVGPYMMIGQSFMTLWDWVSKHQYKFNKGIAIYYDDPHSTLPEKCRSAACIELIETPEETDTVRRINILDGSYLCYRHIGPYANLESTYEKLYSWLPHSEHRIKMAPCFECYLNDPANTPENELITDIYIPIED